MADKTYWLDVAERMIKTGCQALAGVLAGSTLVDMDWRGALAIVGTAVLGSLLTSLASLPVGEAGSASALHVPRVSHDQVIDVIERAARTVQTQTTAGVTAKLDEILKQVKPVTYHLGQVADGGVADASEVAGREKKLARARMTGSLVLGRHAAVDAQTGEDDDTTPTERPTSTDSWGRP